MAIVKMKRLRLVATQQEREALFLSLQRLGCVEISSFEEETPPAAAKAGDAPLREAQLTRQAYESALTLLRRYAPKKKSFLSARPVLREDALFDRERADRTHAAAERLLELQRSIAALRSERSKSDALLLSLRPWAAYGSPLERTETDSTLLFLGTMSAALTKAQLLPQLESFEGLAHLSVIAADKSTAYIAVIAHRSVAADVDAALKALGFTRAAFRGMSGTPEENIRQLEARITEIDTAVTAQEEEIRSMAAFHDDLQLALDRSTVACLREEAKARLVTTEQTFFLSGWLPAEREGEVRTALEQYACAYELEEPAPEEYPEVPVLLKNNKVTGPLSMVTEMYSLPAYGSLDPNPLMAPFFILFYGFMMADMGYGLLMMLAAFVVQKKTKPKGATMRHLVPLLGLCGASTFVMGALTGGFFGDLIPQLVKMTTGREIAFPALFSPLDDALAVLIGSLVLGLLQIFTGMGISMYRQIKRGEVMAALCAEGAWFAVFALFGAGILLGQIKAALLVILLLLVLTQGYGKKGIVGKLMGIGGSLYNNLTGYFSDILSYSRLMALMLAGAVIAQVFNTLGAITGNVILFFLIATVGNALNFALNLLGCYVHDMRLQCLEYFGRFYEDGGKPFRPLAFQTQYVDIVNEES